MTENNQPPQPDPLERPCPFCGHTAPSGAAKCERCKMAINAKSIADIRPMLGPWFIFDKDNPSAPGVGWERLSALIQRGRVKAGSVIRGPATGGLWRLAGETPSVATQLGLCWSCQGALTSPTALCPKCHAVLDALPEPAIAAPVAPVIPATPATPRVAQVITATVITPASAPAAQPQPQAAETVSKLVSAAAAKAGASTAPLPGRRGGNLVATGVLVVAGAVCIGMFVMFYNAFTNRPSRPDSDDPTANLQPDKPAGPVKEAANPPKISHPVGDLYPEIPWSTTGSGGRPANPPVTTASRPVRPPEVVTGATAPTGGIDNGDSLARQKRLAMDLYEQALRARGEGRLMAAQKILVSLINNTDKRALPFGAVGALKDIQDKIVATSQPADDLSATEIGRQSRLTNEIFDKARELEAAGKLKEAQDALLTILNEYDHNAWPAGALDALKRVKDKIENPPPPPPPSDKPTLFGTGDK